MRGLADASSRTSSSLRGSEWRGRSQGIRYPREGQKAARGGLVTPYTSTCRRPPLPPPGNALHHLHLLILSPIFASPGLLPPRVTLIIQ
ncbi:hypothetical protein E2C01_094223 [Portunus trituberculatus]|uniref:Uncharacterized protein n=1 Tax=Portunus trituberculatus TaxID=210409 RepID=A0A5B7K112_PORTR|nr:hypothetical protein [Portunus trituberculatus]